MVYRWGDTVPVLCPEPSGYSAIPPGMVPVSDTRLSWHSSHLSRVGYHQSEILFVLNISHGLSQSPI
jgi:hypothetical protein